MIYLVYLTIFYFHGQEDRTTLRTLSTEGEHTAIKRNRLHQVEKNTWSGSHSVFQP